MANVKEEQQGKIRDLPIKPDLKTLLSKAADDAGIDTVRVTSGGQAKKGSGGKRTGSTRHDEGNAADLMLQIKGHVLSFENPQERPIVAKFVTAAASHGATGIGAGVDYMGEHTLHIGFGSKSVWGAGGKAAKAPEWLKKAVAAAGKPTPVPSAPVAPAAGGATSRQFRVIARNGLRLRSGPGLDHGVTAVLKAGTIVTVPIFDGEWARVDLQDDGLIDGFAFGAFLAPAA